MAGRKIKILIVEDEAILAFCLQRILRELGATVLGPVARGEKAVDVALKEKPSLILMDIRLAGEMDGIETARKILSHHKIPVVFISGYVTEGVKEKALKLKPVAFLEKPLFIPHVKNIINDLMNEQV